MILLLADAVQFTNDLITFYCIHNKRFSQVDIF